MKVDLLNNSWFYRPLDPLTFSVLVIATTIIEIMFIFGALEFYVETKTFWKPLVLSIVLANLLTGLIGWGMFLG